MGARVNIWFVSIKVKTQSAMLTGTKKICNNNNWTGLKN